MSSYGATSNSFTSDRKHTASVPSDILNYQKQQQQSEKTSAMADNASLASYSSTSSLLKQKFKQATGGSWTPKKVQDQAFKTQGRKEKLKMPIVPMPTGPNPCI